MEAETERGANEELAERLQAAGQGTPEAAEIMAELWERNIRLVRKTLHRITGLDYGKPGFEDMEQQAYFGFYDAAYSFSPAAGLKFSTYFTRRIRWELHRYYENNGFTIRIPAFMKRRFRACAEKKRELEADAGGHVSYEDALKALSLSPAAIAGTLAAMRKLETASLDSVRGGETDGDGVSLLDMLEDGTDIEADAIGREWNRELRELLFKAFAEIPEDTRTAIFRRYFSGASFSRMAEGRGITRQTLCNRVNAAFQSVRTGKYGQELAGYLPDMNSYDRAQRRIRQDRDALDRLRLTDNERGLLAL